MSKLIKAALEECMGCNSSNKGYKEISNNTSNGKLKDGFTYDDSKGVKDSVILTGPLSEIYTKALNITLRKTPLVKSEEESPNLSSLDDEVEQNIRSDKSIAATESMKEEDDILVALNGLKNNLSSGEINDIDQNYTFSTIDENPKNVVANIAVMTPDDASSPEVVDKLQTYKETNSNQDTILVVTVPTNNGSEGTKIYNKLINLNPKANILGEDSSAYEQAFENLYEKRGIKVYYGPEGFIDAVRHINRKT